MPEETVETQVPQISFEDAFAAASNGTPVETPVQTEQPQVAPTENSAETIPVTQETDQVVITDVPTIEQPKEIVREVEKIVEKMPDFKSEAARRIFEAGDDTEALKTFYEFAREKNKDYGTMSSMDVVREALKKDNPQWTKNEVELELRVKYGDDLEKIDTDTIDRELTPDEYKEAIDHNRKVDQNLLMLERDARDKRYSLMEAQKTLELPKIEKPNTGESAPQGPTAEEIAEANRQWEAQVEKETQGLGDFKVNIGDKEVVYKYSPEERQQAIAKTKDFNFETFAKDRGWVKEDGTSNTLRIAEDVQLLNNFEKIVKAVSTQAQNLKTKEVIKDIKNLEVATTTADTGVLSFEDAMENARRAHN